MWRPGKLRFLIGVKNPLAIDRPRPPENTAPCGAPPVARFATPVGLRPPFVAHPAKLPHPERRALLILFAAQHLEHISDILSAEAIECLVEAQTLGVHGRSGKDVTVLVRTAAGEQRIEGSDLLVAVGRTPNTAGIGLEQAGVELDGRGYVRVNDRLETSAPDVWAIGECAGSPHFTHVSVDDFQIIRDNFAGGSRSTRDRLIPYCLFTDPPLAHIGLSEGDARRQGVAARVAKLPMSAVLRVQAVGEQPGFMKVLVGERDERILGFTMIGPEAGEVMAAVQTAMLAQLPYPKLRDAVLAHLTMAEGLGFLLSNVPPLR